jgi:uncharacterized membrane protein YeaQ/YmgE (transglycosylase-associated protein family)
MDIVNLLVTLLGGAVGGNVAGAAAPNNSLGTLANTIAGLVGGTAGTYIMQALGIIGAVAATPATGGDIDWTTLLSHLGVSGGSGAAVAAIIGYIKSAMDSKK